MSKIFAVFCLTLTMILSCTGVMGANDLWGELKSGNHLVLIRHALAPGFSDPEGFDIRDCKTQRNLNDMGRQQSRDIGDLFRLNGISRAVIKSSYWCRCIDTARLLNLGQVSELRSLNSFFEHNERKQEQTDAIMKWIQNASLDTPTVLVSHFVNIAALTDYGPESGEIIFVRRLTNGSITVIGSIPTLK